MSNLPGPADCSRQEVLARLTELAAGQGGRVTDLHPARGTANIRFESPSAARVFKTRYLLSRVGDRQINIHYSTGEAGRGRNISFSVPPGRLGRREGEGEKAARRLSQVYCTLQHQNYVQSLTCWAAGERRAGPAGALRLPAAGRAGQREQPGRHQQRGGGAGQAAGGPQDQAQQGTIKPISGEASQLNEILSI